MQFTINYAALSVESTTPPPLHLRPPRLTLSVQRRHTLCRNSSCSDLILDKYYLFQAQNFRPVFNSLDISDIPAGSVRQLPESLFLVTFLHRTEAVCSGPESHVTVMSFGL
jgi:hypothetical protein